MSRLHQLLVLAAAVFGLGAAVVDLRPAVDAAALAAEIDAERDHISAPDLADRIMRRDPRLRIVDLRSRAEYDELHIPSATHATLADLARGPLPRDATIVLYSEGGTHSAQAWVLLRMRGHPNVFFLREGIYEWIARVHEPRLAADATAAERAEFARAAEQSRFFGGLPRADVPRADVPVGYWTGGSNAHTDTQQGDVQPGRAREAIARVRRRGC
jgi:rhodanese-related sulfurtransferase